MEVAANKNFQIGDQLKSIILENGFDINDQKVRLLGKGNRQEVTGLVTNQFVNVRRKYIRQIRAMLHAWKIYGLENVEREFVEKYDTKHRPHFKEPPSFQNIPPSRCMSDSKRYTFPLHLNILHFLHRKVWKNGYFNL